MALNTAEWHSIGIQTCLGCCPTVFEHFWESWKFSSFQTFSHKNEKSWNFMKKATFFQKFHIQGVYSRSTIYSELCIFHAITCTYILVDVYQGFHVSRVYVEIRFNISHRLHSKNTAYSDIVFSDFYYVQGSCCITCIRVNKLAHAQET